MWVRVIVCTWNPTEFMCGISVGMIHPEWKGNLTSSYRFQCWDDHKIFIVTTFHLTSSLFDIHVLFWCGNCVPTDDVKIKLSVMILKHSHAWICSGIVSFNTTKVLQVPHECTIIHKKTYHHWTCGHPLLVKILCFFLFGNQKVNEKWKNKGVTTHSNGLPGVES